MGNEVKTVTNLTAANDKVRMLTKENKELKEMIVHCKNEMDKKDARIKKLEKSLLSAVTNLEWGK